VHRMTAISLEAQAAERRERNRLRSERWRRARGIMPRKPAQRPWLAMGVSRSTYYRRRAKARHEAALAQATAAREAVLDRLQWQLAELRVSLDRCAAANAAMAAELSASPGLTAARARGPAAQTY
jgi:hypothetical protein